MHHKLQRQPLAGAELLWWWCGTACAMALDLPHGPQAASVNSTTS